LKICIITFEYPPQIGGISHAINRIFKNLLKKGIEAHIVVISQNNNISFSEDNIHRFGSFSGNLKEINEIESKKLKDYLLKLDKEYNFNLFHAITIFPCGYLVTQIAKQLNKAVIISARGDDGTKDLLKIDLERKKEAINNADFLTFVSKEMLNFTDKFQPCKNKSKVILNAVDPSEFDYLPNLKKPELKGFVIGIATTIRETKGFEYLLRAFLRFSEEYESTLLLAGGFLTKEIETKYTNLINKLKIQDKVIITDPIKHRLILNYTNLMDIYVLPSLFAEGCPNSLLEAMYLGKPIIASDIGAIPELIRDKENGILVESKNANQIYENLILLKNNKELREKIGTQAKKDAKEIFNPDNESKQWIELYKKVININ